MPDDGTFAGDMEWADAIDATVRDAVTHTARLVETHRITLPAGATGDNVAVARLHAEAYARAHGFELGGGEFSVLCIGGPDGRIGVQFTVTVGVGDIHIDQRTPGVLDRWTWSARAQHWAGLLRRVFPASGGRVMARPADGVASVTAMPGLSGLSGYAGVTVSGGGGGAGGPVGWMGPVALRGFAEGGPVAGGGAQAGTGPLPPWLRRTDPAFDDTASEDNGPGPTEG